MFMNEYSHTIDAKGRMILPAKFREELGSRFVLAPSLDTCLNIYPKERWDALIARLQKLPFTNRNVRKIMRHLIGRGTEMECDRQGRILNATLGHRPFRHPERSEMSFVGKVAFRKLRPESKDFGEAATTTLNPQP